MKKIISINREITFTTMIKEISSICLDHTLKFVSCNNVEGDLIISGSYKMTEASQLEEEFEYKIPVSIATVENYVLDTTNATIDDFSYEVINDDILNVKIDILLEGVEEIVIEEKEEELVREVVDVRECDGDPEDDKVKEIPLKEEEKIVPVLDEVLEDDEEIEVLETKQKRNDDKVKDDKENGKSINSLFMNLTEDEETFSTYLVYIMRKNDSIEKVLDMYSVTREELSNYNDLDSIEVGSKLIIPCGNE